VGEQHLADGGAVQGGVATGAVAGGLGARTDQAFDDEGPVPVEHRQVGGAAGRDDQVLEVGEGGLAQGRGRGEEPELPDPRPDLVAAVGPPTEDTRRTELTDQAVRRGDRQPRPPRDLGERQRAVTAVERVEDGQGP
jgi:hypothetical protein